MIQFELAFSVWLGVVVCLSIAAIIFRWIYVSYLILWWSEMWCAFMAGFWQGINPMWYIAWASFGIGRLASVVLELRDSERWSAFWSPVYDFFMNVSGYIEKRFGANWPNPIWVDITAKAAAIKQRVRA